MPTRREFLRTATRTLVGVPALATSHCGGSAPFPEPGVVRIGGSAHRGVRLASVGDTMIGDAASPRIAASGIDSLFVHLQDLVAEPTALMGNLEAPITSIETLAHPGKNYSYRQDPTVASALARQRFAALALANNHSLDYGPAGLLETITRLQVAGIASVGAGADEGQARRGLVLEFVDGPRVGLLSYLAPSAPYDALEWFASEDAPGCASATEAAFVDDIARLRTHADVVIVHLHFGTNYADVTSDQEVLARAVIDAGADAVNGHHPHIAQAVEIHAGRPILYSLGNFVFGSPGQFGDLGVPGLGLWVVYEIGKSGIEGLEIRGLDVDNRVVDFQPRPIDEHRLARELLPILNARDAGFIVDGAAAVLSLR